MNRTKKRPVAHGRVSVTQALYFAVIMGILGLALLIFFVNKLTALLTFITLIGYAGVYTGYLKRATSQNIVIGGLAGAAPPLLGWTAVTNQLDPQALLLVLIIFTWTPPHFWALAIYRLEEYQHAQIPMLPVTHGIEFTKLNIYLYTILLVVVSVLPFIVGMSSWIYLVGAVLLGARFLIWAHKLYRTDKADGCYANLSIFNTCIYYYFCPIIGRSLFVRIIYMKKNILIIAVFGLFAAYLREFLYPNIITLKTN